MPALTATDLTVVITERWIEGRKRHSRGTIAIAGTNTYPTGGVPLPAKDKFGMVRSLDILEIQGSAGNTTEYVYGYDKTNSKLQLYSSHDTAGATNAPLDEASTANVPGARTVVFHASGW